MALDQSKVVEKVREGAIIKYNRNQQPQPEKAHLCNYLKNQY